MTIRSQARPWLFLHLAAFLVLAMAVFGWGLHYKLSLYHTAAPATERQPEAKLLSQKERPQAASSVADEAPGLSHPDRAHLPFSMVPWLAMLGLALASLVQLVRATAWTRLSALRSATLLRRLLDWRVASSLRPPPPLALLSR
jgi:hypothetical protein